MNVEKSLDRDKKVRKKIVCQDLNIKLKDGWCPWRCILCIIRLAETILMNTSSSPKSSLYVTIELLYTVTYLIPYRPCSQLLRTRLLRELQTVLLLLASSLRWWEPLVKLGLVLFSSSNIVSFSLNCFLICVCSNSVDCFYAQHFPTLSPWQAVP